MTEEKSIFITATDTGVGKTTVCGLLLRFLLEHSIKAGYQKWASTGDRENPADLESCLQTAGLKVDPTILELQVPYRFDFPASPHLSAELENREIDPEKIISAYQTMSADHEVLIVEGVGGLLVPLTRDLLLADLLAQLQIPTIIVARSGLGTLNHTLLTIESLRSRKIPLGGVIFTDGEDDNETLVVDNMKTIAKIGQVEVLGRLPYYPNLQDLFKSFTPVGEKILKQINPTVP
ncbi:MAG: dethiobiotin synthase [Thermodesulfobacteriota bacterium]